MDISSIDYLLLDWINNGLSNSFFDFFLPLLRNKYFWAPFYVFVLSFIILNFKERALYLILFLFLTIGVSDIVSSHLIKKSVKRERPCRNELVKDDIHVLVRCGSGYSFTSSHATNHFAIAGYLFFIFGGLLRKHKWWLMLWAGSISISQVYVGVHYPLDILFGSLLGLLISYILSRIYLSYFGKLNIHYL